MNSISAHPIAFIPRILETPPTNQPHYHYQTTKPLKCSNSRFCSGSNMHAIVLVALWRIKWMKPNAQACAFASWYRITIYKCDTANISISTVFTNIPNNFYRFFGYLYVLVRFEHLATSLCLWFIIHFNYHEWCTFCHLKFEQRQRIHIELYMHGSRVGKSAVRGAWEQRVGAVELQGFPLVSSEIPNEMLLCSANRVDIILATHTTHTQTQRDVHTMHSCI